MAQGAPPHAELHPMRALFAIPKGPPPRLDAATPASAEFRDFVAACLDRDPSRRPPARALLAHAFLARAPAAPPAELVRRVAEHARRRRPVPPPQRDADADADVGFAMVGESAWFCGMH